MKRIYRLCRLLTTKGEIDPALFSLNFRTTEHRYRACSFFFFFFLKISMLRFLFTFFCIPFRSRENNLEFRLFPKIVLTNIIS